MLDITYYQKHNGWPNGCVFQREEGSTVRPSIVSRIVTTAGTKYATVNGSVPCYRSCSLLLLHAYML